MEDIRLAIGLMAFLSVITFAVTYRALRRRSRIWLDVTATVLVALILVYVYTVWGQLWIVRWIPLPSVIVLSNWFPPLLGSLAAVAWLRFEPAQEAHTAESTTSGLSIPSLLRRLPIQCVLMAGAVYSVMYFIPESPPECGEEWEQPMPPFVVWPVCLQTNPNTCSAASAATILNALGEPASEQEMAELCLTKSGTHWLGLYHGLCWKLLGTAYQVEFFEGDGAGVSELASGHPALLCCRLDPKIAEMMPEYVKGGWIPGTAHSVVYFGTLDDGRHAVGDPAVGIELWDSRDLNALWTGQGLKIVERASGAAP